MNLKLAPLSAQTVSSVQLIKEMKAKIAVHLDIHVLPVLWPQK